MTKNLGSNNSSLFTISRIAYLIATHLTLLSSVSFGVQARESFNPDLLKLSNARQDTFTDLSVFEEGGQLPGTYLVDIYLNNEPQGSHNVEFKAGKLPQGEENLQPCLPVFLLRKMGVKTELFPKVGTKDEQCANLNAIPQASAKLRFNSQQLLLSIPQAALEKRARGYVPESEWENGIPALLLNYSLNGSNISARNSNMGDVNTQFANLRPGVNIGPWRLRNYTTWQRDSQNHTEWNSVYTYVSRPVVPLRSQLILGDSTSPGDVFDSVPFRGGQMSSDDDMLPESLRGYAPIVRGIARSNAQVTIRQNGYVIYQNSVTPGAFEITDLYPSGTTGNLFVTIKESDGSEQRLVVPYSALPVLQREGRLKYAVTGGQYRTYDSNVEKTPFGQVTATYGLPHGVTAYGGGQFSSEKYQSAALGVGSNLGDFGALSVDVTQAWSTMQNQPQENGQSWRIRYSKNLSDTGTNLTIAGYRYSTDGYYSMQEVLDTYRGSHVMPLVERRRNRSELSVNQNLWEGGGVLTLSWISEDYWNSDKTMRSVSVGHSNSWKNISYGLNYSYNENVIAGSDFGGGAGRMYDRDHVFSFNFSIPLDYWMKNTYSNYSLNSSKNGGSSHSIGLNGTALADNNLSWGVRQGYGTKGVGNSGNLNADYRGSFGQVNAGYSYDNNNKQFNYGVQGGVLVHENGITLGQPLSETIALVRVPGAKGAVIDGQVGVKTDWRGYAIVPYTTPYRKNQIQLNTESLRDDVELTLTNQTVVPTRGAVVRADFNASVGFRVLMILHKEDGTPVPFGATVSNSAQNIEQGFIVGDNGQVYLTGLAESGTLRVKWGKGDLQQCNVNYSLAKQQTEKTSIPMFEAQCR